jgi:hypothetical protein
MFGFFSCSFLRYLALGINFLYFFTQVKIIIIHIFCQMILEILLANSITYFLFAYHSFFILSFNSSTISYQMIILIIRLIIAEFNYLTFIKIDFRLVHMLYCLRIFLVQYGLLTFLYWLTTFFPFLLLKVNFLT